MPKCFNNVQETGIPLLHAVVKERTLPKAIAYLTDLRKIAGSACALLQTTQAATVEQCEIVQAHWADELGQCTVQAAFHEVRLQAKGIKS